MRLETFFEKFDLFADAPDAVAKMRELVRNLGVTGKLVPQVLNDEPAQETLARIADDVAIAVRAKRMRKFRPIPEYEDEFPFDLPAGWAWAPLGNLTAAEDGAMCDGPFGSKLKTEHYIPTKGYSVLRLGNIGVGYFIHGKEGHISREHFESLPSNHTAPGDLLVAGLADPLVRCCEIPPDIGPAVNKSDCFRVRLSTRVDRSYVRHYLNSRVAKAFAAEENHGMTRERINLANAKALPVSVPPLAEQKRIVAKVDELMALCDMLEEQQQERQTRHTALARASLARFAAAPTPANLEFLFHKSYDINPADLRKSILTLAVQGKLVPQDPNDEPAGELIPRIAEIRRKKKVKEYRPVSEDEIPYHVPDSWSWTRLGNISLTSDSGWSPQCLSEARLGAAWGVLKVSAVTWGVFKPDENKALPPGMTGRPECEVKVGDFLLSRANTDELVARSVVVEETPPRLMMSDKIVRFTFPEEIDRHFINLVNASEVSRDYYAGNASGTSSSMKNIGREVMCNLPVPIPPLAEQRRIVAKVDELMALVDALETQLATARTTAVNLLTAAVAELTNATPASKPSFAAKTDVSGEASNGVHSNGATKKRQPRTKRKAKA